MGAVPDGLAGREPASSPVPGPPTRLELLGYKIGWTIAIGISRLYLPGRVIGRENLPATGPYLLAPVHRSYVDWLIVARVTGRRRLRFIAKSELWKSRLVGRVLEFLGVFPVNRSGADREALDRCRKVLAGGEPLVMFPEGTRRSGPAVTDLREGVAYLAVRAGVPVVPVGIGGSERVMPRGSAIPKPRRVDVVIGSPVWPPRSGGEGAEAAGEGRAARVSRRATKEFSDRVAAAIQEVFDEAEHRVGIR